MKSFAFLIGVTMVVMGMLSLRASAGEAKNLIGADTTGWKTTKGQWKVVDGALQNEIDPNTWARIETQDDYGNFTLKGKLIMNAGSCEIQVKGVSYPINRDLLDKGKLGELEITAKGEDVKVLIDGKEVKPEDATQKPTAQGKLSFYIPKGGELILKELKLTAQ